MTEIFHVGLFRIWNYNVSAATLIALYNDAMLYGDGTGTPSGVINAPKLSDEAKIASKTQLGKLYIGGQFAGNVILPIQLSPQAAVEKLFGEFAHNTALRNIEPEDFNALMKECYEQSEAVEWWWPDPADYHLSSCYSHRRPIRLQSSYG